MTRFLIAMALLSASSRGFAAGTATSAGNPVIEAVYGNGAPALTIGEESYELQEGQELKPGNKVTTDAESAVRILYPDNSQLYVGRSSEVEITGTRDGAPVTTLNQGKTRAIVAKSDAPEGKAKFLIRTKSAVMGVRGTDFVTQADTNGGSCQVHTLEGQVAVASPGEESSLFSGKGLLLGPNQFVMTKLGSVLGRPQLFKRAEFLKALDADQPGFRSLMDRVPRGYHQLMKLKGPGNVGNTLQRKNLPDGHRFNRMQKIPGLRR